MTDGFYKSLRIKISFYNSFNAVFDFNEDIFITFTATSLPVFSSTPEYTVLKFPYPSKSLYLNK